MNFVSRCFWRSVPLACLAWIVASAAAPAADKLDVILVQASNEGSSDVALQAYSRLLSRFGFKSYRIAARKQAALSAGDVSLAQGFKATLGTAEGRRVPVTISRGPKNLIRTVVNFSPGSPVVLGAYDGDGGAKMVIILVLSAG